MSQCTQKTKNNVSWSLSLRSLLVMFRNIHEFKMKQTNKKTKKMPQPKMLSITSGRLSWWDVCSLLLMLLRYSWHITHTLQIHIQHKCKANILEIQNRDKTNKIQIRYNDAVCWWYIQFMKYYRYITHLLHLQNKYNTTAIK